MSENSNSAGSDPLKTEKKESKMSQRDQRSLVFHLLYAMEANEYSVSLESVVHNFNAGFDLNISMDDHVVVVSRAVVDLRDELDDAYQELLNNWRFERLGVCTMLILRYAIWELIHTDMDPTIVINEAVELAKCYAEKDAYKFVNGILDQFAKKDKPAE